MRVGFTRDRKHEIYAELKEIAPHARIFRTGTDDGWNIEFFERSEAHLFANLARCVYGVRSVGIEPGGPIWTSNDGVG